MTLPDLDEATHVLFAGASAGGSGVHANADRVGELLRAQNVAFAGAAGPLVYGAVIDSHFFPDRERLDYSKTPSCAVSAELCTYEGFIRNLQYSVSIVRNEVGDASCLAYHRTVEAATEWICSDSGHVIRNHITTPMFIGQDEQDQLLGENYTESGFGSLTDFGNAVEAELRGLATLDGSAEEGIASSGTPLARPGTWGPQCRSHELLGSNADFFRTVVSGGGVSLSYHDVVWNWWSGASPIEAIRDFTTPGAVAGCP